MLPFDASLLVLAWKAGGRLVCRVRTHLPEGWSVQSVISDLCVAMEAKALACVENAPTTPEEVGSNSNCMRYPSTACVTALQAASSVFSKLLKVCRFLATLLVRLAQASPEPMLPVKDFTHACMILPAGV